MLTPPSMAPWPVGPLEAEFLFVGGFKCFGQNHQRVFLFEIATNLDYGKVKIKNCIILNNTIVLLIWHHKYLQIAF
jgi:hypothetical protein